MYPLRASALPVFPTPVSCRERPVANPSDLGFATAPAPPPTILFLLWSWALALPLTPSRARHGKPRPDPHGRPAGPAWPDAVEPRGGARDPSHSWRLPGARVPAVEP